MTDLIIVTTNYYPIYKRYSKAEKFIYIFIKVAKSFFKFFVYVILAKMSSNLYIKVAKIFDKSKT